MTHPPDSPRDPAGRPAARSSASRRAAGFALRHPAGVAHALVVLLIVVVVLQNLEPTSIDVLFWSFAAVPKLVLILGSMLAGALVWEIGRRLIVR